MSVADTHRAVLAVWRTEQQRLVAILARMLRDVPLAEELAQEAPDEPEVHGLLGMMELHASRASARIDANGSPILLLDQNRARWDRLLINRGLAALARAEQLGGAGGFYALQAAILACHARAPTAADTDWPRIAALYAQLYDLTLSPIVAMNRAVAVSMAEGPASGLAMLDMLASEPALKAYHLLPSARADMLQKLGRLAEARTEFLRAADLAGNERERAFLLKRADDALQP